MEPATVESGFGFSEFVSALVGAGIALVFDALREKFSRHRNEADTANRAILTIAQMFSQLGDLWEQIYKEPVEQTAKQGRIPHPPEVAAMSAMPDPVKLDVGELSFLLRGTDPDLPNRLAAVERGFQQIVIMETVRTQLHVEMQGRLEAAGLKPGQALSLSDVQGACGPRLWAQIVAATNFQVQVIPQTITDLLSIQEQLTDAVKFQFPSRRFVKVERRKLEPGERIGKTVLPPPAIWRRAVRASWDRIRKRRAREAQAREGEK